MKRRNAPIRRREATRPASLSFESLEKRQLLAVTLDYDAAQKTLILGGDSSDDYVEISEVSRVDRRLKVVTRGAEGLITTIVDQPVEMIAFRGGAGNDTFINNTGVASNLQGEAGNDILIGGSGNDWITGQEDNDIIDGRDGNDTLYGYVGDDVIYGGRGHDYISGFDGADQLFGGDGNDQIWAGYGNDRLFGEGDNDHLEGMQDNDWIDGGIGEDKLYGWTGNDVLKGGAGNDYLSGYEGNDELFGGDGADLLDGGAGVDKAFGEGGYDRYRNATAWVPTGSGNYHYVLNAESGTFMEGPYGSPQRDGWSCGPNSAYRFLQHYGKTHSLDTVKFRADGSSLLYKFKLGLTPSRLRDVIKSFGVSASVREESSLDSMLGELAKGKPVIALIQNGTTTDKTVIFGKTIATSTRPNLHWIFVNGYDASKRTIFYTDTDGHQYSSSYTNFSRQWNWNPSGFNPGVRAALKAAGLKSRTFIV